ncbi:MFS general substrate transporter [Neoconidiobolus thromboides FSU 785]|nr:MFS general substrate transporter [Neoconidiobolus thromboides FSU 785]
MKELEDWGLEPKITCEETAEEEQYKRFSKLRRSLMLILVSVSAILSPLSSTIYFPSLEVIKEELNTTASLVDATISVFMLCLGLFPLIWGGLSDRYGRRNVYIISQVIYTCGNIGCALSTNINALIVLRMIQGIGSSAPIVTGVGTITDLYPRNERGSALSIFFLGPLVGPVIGPIIGGFLNQYLGWRSCFWTLAILGGILLISSLFLLKETLPLASFQKPPYKFTLSPFSIKRDGPIFNPLFPLGFLKYPVVILAVFCISLVFGSFFAVESSQSRAMATIYELNSSQVGLTFVALGIGSILGNLVAGRISDLTYRRAEKKGTPQPEVRLHLLWIGSLIILAGHLLYGWFLEYKFNLWATLVGNMIVGIGNTSSLIGLSNYLVDIFPNYASSIAACYSCVELIFTAIVTAINTPLIEAISFGWAFTFWAAMCFIVCLTLISLIYKGVYLRNRFGPNN